jgi:hypothetical protein
MVASSEIELLYCRCLFADRHLIRLRGPKNADKSSKNRVVEGCFVRGSSGSVSG